MEVIWVILVIGFFIALSRHTHKPFFCAFMAFACLTAVSPVFLRLMGGMVQDFIYSDLGSTIVGLVVVIVGFCFICGANPLSGGKSGRGHKGGKK